MAVAVGGAFACLEAVHSTWTGYRCFNLVQNTADDASAGHPLDALARLARALAAMGGCWRRLIW